MIVTVPKRALNMDFTEQELVFLDFMNSLMYKQGRHTEFYFYAKDIKKMTGTLYDPAMRTIQDKFKEFYRIGIVNEFTLRIVWTNNPKNLKGKSTIANEKYTLTDPTAIGIYWFLKGRLTDPTLVDMGKPKIYDGTQDNYHILNQTLYKLL